MTNYLQQAFNHVCQDAKTPEGYYVSLMENRPYYGGPEEGGWWGNDTVIVAYKWFPTEEEATAAKKAVETIALEFQAQAQRAYGEHCLRELEWLEARGLEADFLPEPDGPSEFYVLMTEGLPKENRGSRHYE